MQNNTTRDPKKNEKFVVALELGSSRAKMGIAGFDPQSPQSPITVYNTVALPTVDSVRYGRINNIREVTETVNSLLEKLENHYPIENRNILSVYISIGGRTLKSKKISARIVLPERREITEDLIERLRDDAIESMATDDELIYVEPIRFNVDNMTTPRPVGSLGTRLAAEFTAVVCSPSNKADIENVVSDRIKLNISGSSVRPIALAQLVLKPQEINAGCMLVDFGAETITVAIYKKYALQYLATIPLGSRLITRDIASILALPEEEAEEIKIKYGDAIPDKKEVPDPENRHNRETINAVVSARLADIVANIGAQPSFAGVDNLPGGIILTGGGAKLRNFARLLEAHTSLKVRLATVPLDIIINDPQLAEQDNFDIIALLNAATHSARSNNDPECVTAPVEKDPVIEEVANPVQNEEVLIDFTQKTQAASKVEVPPTARNYGYEDTDFSNPMSFNTEDHGHYADDETASNPFEDNGQQALWDDSDSHWLMDDDKNEEEAEKERQAALRRQEAEKQRQQAEAQRKKKKEERDRNKANTPSRINRIINLMTGILSGSNDDESADMD